MVEEVPSTLWKTAGKLKTVWKKVSLADCFALALAIEKSGSLVTSDHHEFEPLVQAKACPIRFIR